MPDRRPVRLHCFAHAGAGVSAFHGWTTSAGPGVEPVPVLLPGRGRRRSEPRITTRDALLADVLPLVTAARPGPYVLYGHSLGALVALTLTRALHEAGMPGPALLAVGACPPPQAPSPLSDAHDAPDGELLDLLHRMGAVPPGSARDGIWDRLVLPVLRSDLELAQALRTAALEPSAAGPLTTPLLIVASPHDPLAPPQVADGWRHWTQGPTRLRVVRGDHFFVRGTDLPRLLGRACRTVSRLATAPALAR
ncbi:thioesterase II family protein [Streptomyces sp. NPDC093105]|uniref:thioesterase II family protein n=2 Tax=unclassified Streptomyces TaxID=2593676 RepID=UPI0037F912B0